MNSIDHSAGLMLARSGHSIGRRPSRRATSRSPDCEYFRCARVNVDDLASPRPAKMVRTSRPNRGRSKFAMGEFKQLDDREGEVLLLLG
jgi:hypothetical protein